MILQVGTKEAIFQSIRDLDNFISEGDDLHIRQQLKYAERNFPNKTGYVFIRKRDKNELPFSGREIATYMINIKEK